MLRFFLLFLIALPLTLLAQSKKKLLKLALEKDRKQKVELISNLKRHIEILASDSFEGRRAGTKGETLAMNYLITEYKKIGLDPANGNNYLQSVVYNEGKFYKNENTFLRVNNQNLQLEEDFFPLSYSINNRVKSNAAIALKESGEIWFVDINEALEENKENPHFDINTYIKKEISKASSNKATGIVFYNSSLSVDNVFFNKKDTSTTAAIPAIFLTANGRKKYFKDIETTSTIELSVFIENRTRTLHNVVGFINNNATHTVVLGAHYDHLGFGEDANALDTSKKIHNGADDNASGCAALLELSKLLKQSTFKGNNYLIVHFSGEELGLIGSKYWLENPTINISKNYMINMDMVGRYDSSHKLTIGGFGTSPTWSEILQTTPTSLLTKYDSTGSGPSDHASFYRKEIPVLFFFTGSHSDYHKATDDYEKINYTAEADIIKYIFAIVEKADSKGKLHFTKTTESAMGKSSKFTVSLGVIPDYGFSGTGVKIDGVSAGKIAEKIGLQTGDILMQLGEYKFADVMGYMQVLSKFKKGDTTILIIKRKDEQKEFEVIF